MDEAAWRLKRPFSVLVADDDPIIRDAVGQILKSYGYDIHFAENGNEAWDAVRSRPVDLALIDLTMPGLSGFDFIGRCRADPQHTRMPIIVMTAATDAEACDRAFDLGATSYVTKPIHWALFTHSVWYVLRNEAREAELRDLKARFGLETAPPRPTL